MFLYEYVTLIEILLKVSKNLKHVKKTYKLELNIRKTHGDKHNKNPLKRNSLGM